MCLQEEQIQHSKSITFLSLKNKQKKNNLKVETGLQQLVHSLRRQAAVGQEEGGESLVGSQIFFHWQVWGGNRNNDQKNQKQAKYVF